MEAHSDPECSCIHNLGVHQLTDHDILNGKEFQRKHKLTVEAVNFIGAANNYENTTVQDKINEVKEKLAEYSFNNDKIISIPNQVPLTERPALLKVHLDKLHESRFLGNHIEDVLHQQTINSLYLINKDMEAFVMNGFESKYCFKEKINQAETDRNKLMRNDKKTKRKGDKYPPLNKHEEELLEILAEEDENIDVKVSNLVQIHDCFKQEVQIAEILRQKGEDVASKDKGKDVERKVKGIQKYLKENQIDAEFDNHDLISMVVKESYNFFQIKFFCISNLLKFIL